MMLPMPCSIICGSTALQPYQAPSRSMAKQRRQSSSVISSGSRNTLTPAQLTSTSIRPCSSMASLAIACRSCWLDTSALIAWTSKPLSRHWAATLSTFSPWISLMTSLACWDAKVGDNRFADTLSGAGQQYDLVFQPFALRRFGHRWQGKRFSHGSGLLFEGTTKAGHLSMSGQKAVWKIAASLHLFCFFKCECV